MQEALLNFGTQVKNTVNACTINSMIQVTFMMQE